VVPTTGTILRLSGCMSTQPYQFAYTVMSAFILLLQFIGTSTRHQGPAPLILGRDDRHRDKELASKKEKSIIHLE
jgi:hypothetical protein